MKHISSIIVFFLVLFSSCASPPDLPTPTHEPGLTLIPVTITAPATGTFAAHPSATVTSLPSESTKTPALTQIASPFPSSTATLAGGSPTPSIPIALSPNNSDSQCFKGPGTGYQPSYTFKTAEIVGKDETGLWWYLKTIDKLGNSLFCWVNIQKTTTAGSLSNVSIAESETASVTAVNISIDGNYTQQVACGQMAEKPEFRFAGEIVSNGPIPKLRYQWETNAGAKYPPEQIQVPAWDDPAMLKLDLLVPAQDGEYSLTLRTIYPNEVVRIVQFVVKCR